MRGRGEGSVVRRKNGTWEAKLSLGYDAAGKRIRKVVYAPTKAAALNALATLRLEAGKGYVSGDRLTLAEFLERWLQDHVDKKCRYKTQKSYRDVVTRYIVPCLGTLKMTEIRPTTMDGFIAALGKLKYVGKGGKPTVGVPPASTFYACNVFKIAIRWAAAKEVIDRNPFADVRLVHPVQRVSEPWTVEDAGTFFNYVESRNEPLAALFKVDALTGLRHGELLALRWTDVDLKTGTISVAHTLEERLDGGATRFSLQPVKTKSSVATIAIPDVAVAALREHRLRAGATGISEFVFMTRNGTHYLQTNVLYKFKKLCLEAGVPVLRVHDLRHTCATLLRKAGMGLDRVQAQLRHSDIAVTQRYAHVTPEVTRDNAEAMDGMFSGGKK